MSDRRASLAIAAAGAALLASIIVAFGVGRFPISTSQLVAALYAKLAGHASGVPATVETVIFNVRGPRVLAALLVGAALSGAGAAYQSLFRNPLVSPDILGVSSGAAFGAALGILLALDAVLIQGLAFGFGLLAVAAAYGIASRMRSHDPVLVLVLAGVVLGALFGACVALVKYLADPYNQLPAITYWLLGSLAAANAQDCVSVLPAVLAGCVALWLLRWRISVLSLGDEEAAALGVPVRAVRAVVVLAATLMTAAVVSISGIIGWVGLLIPHVARLLVGPEFTRLLPLALVLGAAFMLGVDTTARTAARLELPLGVLTAFIGTPVFVWLLAASRRSWQ